MGWKVVYLNDIAKNEVEALPPDLLAKFIHISAMIRDMGLDRIREPYVKHLKDELWEMHLKGRSGIARSIYVTAHKQRVVILRTFIKKTQKTPNRELKLALKRAKEII